MLLFEFAQSCAGRELLPVPQAQFLAILSDADLTMKADQNEAGEVR